MKSETRMGDEQIEFDVHGNTTWAEVRQQAARILSELVDDPAQWRVDIEGTRTPTILAAHCTARRMSWGQ